MSNRLRYLAFFFLFLFMFVQTSLPSSAQAKKIREISINGATDLKLKLGDHETNIEGGLFDQTVLTVDRLGKVTLTKNGKQVASAKPKNSTNLEIFDGEGKILFQVVSETGNSYRIIAVNANDLTRTSLSRVKLKGDKFNVYGLDEKLQFHGKKDDEGYKVVDEAGALALKIKGTSSLRETSTLATSVPLVARLLLWAAWYEKRSVG